MCKASYSICVGMAIVYWLALPLVALAEDSGSANMLYSRGVHAYFDGRTLQAELYLTQAVEANPNDPRPYFFRAMSQWRQGRQEQARDDMQIGAGIEARRPGRYAIGEALERVQGNGRLVLEEYRRDARLAEVVTRDELQRDRYEHTVRREPDVLRREVNISFEQLLELAESTHIAERGASSLSTGDPFVDDLDPAEPSAERVAQSAWIEGNTLDSQSPVSDTADIGNIPPGSKVKPSELFGILGRVVRRAAGGTPSEPTDDVQIGEDGNTFDFGFAPSDEEEDHADFGPDDPFGFQSQPVADESDPADNVEGEDEFFGDVGGQSEPELNETDDSEDDLFGIDDDDPFGGF